MRETRTYLDNPVHGNTSLSNNTLDVLTAHLGLIRNAALDQVALCVSGNLARDVECGASDYGLGLLGELASGARVVVSRRSFEEWYASEALGRAEERTYGPAATYSR
jgi:hypothetical protein